MTFKAVALKAAAVSVDVWPICPLHADLQLLRAHVKYHAHAWLVTEDISVVVQQGVGCDVGCQFCLCLTQAHRAVAYTCGPELSQAG